MEYHYGGGGKDWKLMLKGGEGGFEAMLFIWQWFGGTIACRFPRGVVWRKGLKEDEVEGDIKVSDTEGGVLVEAAVELAPSYDDDEGTFRRKMSGIWELGGVRGRRLNPCNRVLFMIRRAIETEFLTLLGEFPVVTVLGPRQAGKTTLVRSLLSRSWRVG